MSFVNASTNDVVVIVFMGFTQNLLQILSFPGEEMGCTSNSLPENSGRSQHTVQEFHPVGEIMFGPEQL